MFAAMFEHFFQASVYSHHFKLSKLQRKDEVNLHMNLTSPDDLFAK